MASLLMKKLTCTNPLVTSCRHRNLTLMTPIFHFSTQIQDKKDLPFIAQYLISSFGFSEDRALKNAADKNLAPIKTPERPESVIRFLKDIGLTDSQIKIIIYSVPQLLSKSVSKTLEPWLHQVINGGFKKETIIQLIVYNPSALCCNKPLPRLQFWRNFTGSEKVFMTVVKRRPSLNLDIDKKVIPTINLLREYGLSNQQIARVIANTAFQSLESIKLTCEQVEKLGIPRDSKMFTVALAMFVGLKKETIERKLEFLKKTCGWSEEETLNILKKWPPIIGISEDNVKSKLNFLIEKAEINPKNLIAQPALFGYSLEKRLVPRHYVFSVLKSKELIKRCNLYSMVSTSEKDFVRRYIERFEKVIPDLAIKYATFCAGK